VEFLWVGGHPGVDLCNTTPVVDGQPLELLDTPADLRAWLDTAVSPDLLPNRAAPNQATLDWARRLRHALRAVLTADVDRSAPLRRLNTVLGELTAVPAVGPNGALHLRAAGTQTTIRLALAQLAIDACALSPERVRHCANPRCVLIFYDTTKSGTRRWHDMATCGNQAKAAAHYTRLKQRQPGSV
jgi:predicted RNA-binding Zn ribbon-like protein